jgi:methylated-DNA-[protein]-cysteine S-methyltransferase
MQLFWDIELIQRIDLQWAVKIPEQTWKSSWYNALEEASQRYVKTGRTVWPVLPLNWSGMSDFRKKVLKTLQENVGCGYWISYSGLASLCGAIKTARAVGTCMRFNPWPLIVPCHRVLKKDGSLGGFSSGLRLKKYLLELEKTEFKN